MDQLYLKYVYLDGLYYCIRCMGDTRTENLICQCARNFSWQVPTGGAASVPLCTQRSLIIYKVV